MDSQRCLAYLTSFYGLMFRVKIQVEKPSIVSKCYSVRVIIEPYTKSLISERMTKESLIYSAKEIIYYILGDEEKPFV